MLFSPLIEMFALWNSRYNFMGIMRNARCPNLANELDKGSGAFLAMPLRKGAYVIEEQSMGDSISAAQCSCSGNMVAAKPSATFELDDESVVTSVATFPMLPKKKGGIPCGMLPRQN